jgi:hypothetical protein
VVSEPGSQPGLGFTDHWPLIADYSSPRAAKQAAKSKSGGHYEE